MKPQDRESIRRFLGARLRAKDDCRSLGDSDSLFLSGRLDSLDAMETVAFLERSFDVDFSEIGFDQALIDSVDAIGTLIERA